jgi:hypothetical protein
MIERWKAVPPGSLFCASTARRRSGRFARFDRQPAPAAAAAVTAAASVRGTWPKPPRQAMAGSAPA